MHHTQLWLMSALDGGFNPVAQDVYFSELSLIHSLRNRDYSVKYNAMVFSGESEEWGDLLFKAGTFIALTLSLCKPSCLSKISGKASG